MPGTLHRVIRESAGLQFREAGHRRNHGICFLSADCVRPNVKFNHWEEGGRRAFVLGPSFFTRSRLLDRFIILTYGECCVCGLANMPNELDMIDSVAILRSRWEIVRQMRESIKVMTVRIRVVIRRSKIIRFMSRSRRPTPSRNFHRNEKKARGVN